MGPLKLKQKTMGVIGPSITGNFPTTKRGTKSLEEGRRPNSDRRQDSKAEKWRNFMGIQSVGDKKKSNLGTNAQWSL